MFESIKKAGVVFSAQNEEKFRRADALRRARYGGGPGGHGASLSSLVSKASDQGFELPDDVYSLDLAQDIVDILQENTDCMIEESVALERAPFAA